MRATIDYIERKFLEFNQQMFEGKLEPLPFRLSTARTFLGLLRFYRDKFPDGTVLYRNFQFVISTRVDLPECEVEDIIIHEMIHYWILSNQMHDTSPHGEIFKHKMKEINQKFNRNLSVAYKVTKEEADRDNEVRQHFICVSRLNDGRCGVTIAAKTRLFRLWNSMSKFSNLVEQKWMVSTNPYFNRFPRSIKPKIYPVPNEELELHLKDARELKRRGNTVMFMDDSPSK